MAQLVRLMQMMERPERLELGFAQQLTSRNKQS